MLVFAGLSVSETKKVNNILMTLEFVRPERQVFDHEEMRAYK